MTGWTLPVATFWAGEPISFVEQMVIRSYLDQGCDFTIYLAEPVAGIPEGARIADAAEIMPKPGFVSDPPTRKELAVWSDLFRVALLRKRQVAWVDADAYCVRPFELEGGYGFGLNGEGGVLSGVMALPPESPTLLWMDEFLSAEILEPPWVKPFLIQQRRKKGTLGPDSLNWGDTGPRLLTYALQQCGEFERALPKSVFYPLFRQTLRKLWAPGIPDQGIVTDNTQSVHIFGYTKRVMVTHWNGLPPPGSWLARMAERHGIDPAAAPATGMPLPQKT